MRVRPLAFFFVFLLSSEYLLGVAVAVASGGLPCCKKRMTKRQTGCSLQPQLVKKLDDCLERVRSNIPDTMELEDHTVEEYEMSNGISSGWRNFQKRPYRCSCGRNFVRVFIEISYLRILVSFVLNLLEDLLGGLLGSLGSGLARVLGNVVNLLVRVLALDILVQITIIQRFIPGTRCVVESYRVSKLTNIRLLGLELRPVAELLSPLLAPVLDLLLGIILNGRVKEAFVRELQRLVITRGEVIC